jgi:hypothetical protein
MKKLAFVAAVSLLACGKKSDHGPAAGSGDDALAKVSELRDRACACKDKACATKVNDDYTQWGVTITTSGGDQRPDEAMAKKMTEVAMAYSDCFVKAMAVAAPPSPPAEATGQHAEPIPFSGSTGIPECDAYKAAVDAIVACDKMPTASRDVMKDALGQALLSIRSLPADGKKEAGTACAMGLDAIKQAAKAVGCDVSVK